MQHSPNARQIVFTGKQCAELQPLQLETPGAGEAVVRTEYSLMSTGTENIVFNREFDEGTHWDNWVKYPFFPGYSAVGTVEAVGPDAGLAPGQRVALRSSHRSHHIVSASKCLPIPDGVAFEHAAWFALAKIAFQGARAAAYHLGDRVLIIGAGPIGQMSIRWAAAAGAISVVTVDSAAERMALAQAGGSTAVISSPIEEAGPAIGDAMGGERPTIVIDSTGNARVFESALKLVADHGKVVLLGDTGRPAQQRLTSDVITRGLAIVGAHDCHNDAQWNDASIAQLFFALIASGRFPLEGLNTHLFKPEECARAYEVANRERSKTMGIVFDWRG